MSFWKNYDVDPNVVALGDQYDQMGETFLDNLLKDVFDAFEEFGEYPVPCILAAEMAKAAEEHEIVEVAIPLALGAAMIRLAKIEAGLGLPPDISGLDFECDS